MVRRRTRRRFLGAAGVAVSIAGCIANAGLDGPEATETATPTDNSTPTESPPPTDATTPTDGGEEPAIPENGAVAFVYDDGRMKDYTKVLPVHEEFDAPATTGVVSSYVGRKYYMDVEQIEALQEAGWEIASHTVEHTAVGSYDLVAATEPADTCIYPHHVRHGHHAGKTLEITDGERTVHRPIEGIGEDEDGVRYVELADPVGEAFPAGETTVRYPAEFVEESLAKSKRELESLGFEVDTLLAPYDNFTGYSMEFVPDHYDYVANARHGSFINHPETFDPYETRRDYYVEYTEPEHVRRALNEVAESGCLGVLGAHPFQEVVTQERIRETLEWIEARDIEVMTLREACRCFEDGGES